MRVYLLQLDDERTVIFYGAPEPKDAGEPAPRAGFRGWLVRKYRGLRDAVEGAASGPGAWARRVWEWLRRWTSPDEPMLRALREVGGLTIHYPESIGPNVAHDAWRDYLAARRRRHGFWLALDLLMAPLTALMAPIPGPNIIAYWVLYRGACHVLALLGIRRAIGRTATAKFIPYEEPEPWADDAARIAALEARHGLDGVAAFVQESRPARRRDAGDPVAGRSRCDS